MRIGVLALAAVVGLTGCGLVTVQPLAPPGIPRREAIAETPFVPSKGIPDPRLGYLAGRFSRGTGDPGYGYIVVDALGNEYALAFDEVNAKYGLAPGAPAMVALPPGDYRVRYWMNPAWSHAELISTDVLGRPFAVRPGHVVFLGAFTADQWQTPGAYTAKGTWWTTHFRIESHRLPADEARSSLSIAYPAFEAAPMECILCSAPSSATAPSAAPALPQDGDFAEARNVVVHLRRTELERYTDSYFGCGLTAWEVVAGTGARREVVGASLRKPLDPTGRDDFGVSWAVNDRNFRDGTMHLTVRCGAQVLQGLEGVSFRTGAAREIWVVEGEPTLYRSRADADRAHPPVKPDEAGEGDAAEDEDESGP